MPVITFDKSEAQLRSLVPLHAIRKHVQDIVQNVEKVNSISVDFGWNGYCTDVVIKTILDNFKDSKIKGISTVDLRGCTLLTDRGIKWLCDLLQHLQSKNAQHEIQILLDGCKQLTDVSIGLLFRSIPKFSKVFASKTKFRHAFGAEGLQLEVKAAPLLQSTKDGSTKKNLGHILIIPTNDMRNSVSDFVATKSVTKRESSHFLKDVEIDDWKMALTEMSLENAVFDTISNCDPVHVVIPFGANEELKDIKEHVLDVISRVSAKEKPLTRYPEFAEFKLSSSPDTSEPFFDFFNCFNQIRDEGIIGNFSVGEILGCAYSSVPLSRSHPYFEVICKSRDSSSQLGVIVGCLFDVLYDLQDPMNNNAETGGSVTSVECNEGDVCGFGIEGEWQSEYIPKQGFKFYFTVNGIKKESESRSLNLYNTACSQYYPIVAALGDGGSIKCEVPHLCKHSESMKLQLENEGKYIRKGFLSNTVIDEDGILSFYQDLGYFLSEQTIKDGFKMTLNLWRQSSDQMDVLKCGVGNIPKELDTNNSIYFDACAKCISLNGEEKPNMEFPGANDLLPNKPKIQVKIEVTCDKTEENEKHLIIFDINGQKSKHEFKGKMSGEKSLAKFFIIAKAPGLKVQIQEYEPPVRILASIPEKITLGRMHVIKDLSSLGDLYPGYAGNLRFPADAKVFPLFIAKTPLHSGLLSFDVKVSGKSSLDDEMSIGFGHFFTNHTTLVGMQAGTIGYCNNSKLLVNGQTLTESAKEEYYDSLIQCGVRALPGNTLSFGENGYLKSQQMVTVYFLRDGKEVAAIDYEHVSDGLYPCMSFKESSSFSVTIKNFYTDCFETRSEIAKRKMDLKMEQKEEKEDEVYFHGCNFTVVGFGHNGADSSAKVQELQNLLNLGSFFPALQHAKTSVEEIKGKEDTLDVQDQVWYGQLQGVQENYENLAKTQKHRLKFISADFQTGKGQEDIRKQIISVFRDHQKQESFQYELPEKMWEYISKITQALQENKIMPVFPKSFGINDLCTDKCIELVKFMHNKGLLAYLWLDGKHMIIDHKFIATLIAALDKVANMELSGELVTALGGSCHVWKQESFESNILNLAVNKKLLNCFLQDILGVLHLPCFRIEPDQPFCVHTTLSHLSAPPMSLREYWSKDSQDKDTITMQVTYSFPYKLPNSILSVALSYMVQFGRTILLTADGAVFQMGAVQTVVIQHEGMIEKGVISIEAKCHFASEMIEPVNNTTEINMQEYTWQVLCLYTDVMDYVLHHHHLVPLISRSAPTDFLKISVGCKHNWEPFKEGQIQSVCTLCNQCCDKGASCKWNGIVGNNLRECGCGTSVCGCQDCGICIRCAKKMWKIRSVLRPNPSLIVDTNNIPEIPFDPTAFNKSQISIIGDIKPKICLKEINDGSIISVFPGSAHSLVETDVAKVNELLKTLEEMTSPMTSYSQSVHDTITLRLTDPLGAIEEKEEKKEEGIVESRTVYYCTIDREVRVSQETGLVCYESASGSLPVAQLIGPKPFSESFSEFSIQVVCKGDKGTIAVGVCPSNYQANNQPGWRRFSVAYHGDDGGIFCETGFPTTRAESYTEGDIIKVSLNVKTRKLSFFKNDKMVHSLNVNFPRGGYHPVIGMHSRGEAVKLLERDPWLATEEEGTRNKPRSFDTHRYGNMCISPGKVLTIVKVGRKFMGWIVLSNPTSNKKTAYRIRQAADLLKTEDCIGILQPGTLKAIHVVAFAKKDVFHLDVQWTSVEMSKEYTIQDAEHIFETTDTVNISRHKLNLSWSTQSISKNMEELPRVDVTQDNTMYKDSFLLEVYKNKSLVDKYWMKAGNYQLYFPTEKGSEIKRFDLLISNIKYPTYLYPQNLKAGMKTIIYINDQFAEGLISEVHGTFGVSVDFNPEESSDTETVCFGPGLIGFDADDWSDANMVSQLKLDPEQEFLNRTYIYAPPYLVTDGSAKAVLSTDPYWKTSELNGFSSCNKFLTRVTVCEQMMTKYSRDLESWAAGYGVNGKLDTLYAFLSSNLGAKKLKYPSIKDMFEDLCAHVLCFSADQMRHFAPSNNLKDLNVPIHFADIPGNKVTEKPPIDLTFACKTTGWVYTALLAKKLLLPSYKKLFEEDVSNLKRKQVESLLYRYLHPYASLCWAYAIQFGGLQNQMSLNNGGLKITQLLKKRAPVNTTKFTGEPISDTHTLIKSQRTYTCKGHHITLNGNSAYYAPDLVLQPDYIMPYGELMNAFNWTLTDVPELPQDLFKYLTNLQCFFLSDCSLSRKPEIPLGLGTCCNLTTIFLSDVGIHSLPKDIFLSPSLKKATIYNLLIEDLDVDWPETSSLTELEISNTRLVSVPPGIAKLSSLKTLILDNNPITDLPVEMENLKNLKTLSIGGIPWITFKGKRTTLTRELFHNWLDLNKAIIFNLGKEKAEKLFDKFDINSNGELDESEIATLNVHLFVTIPRLCNPDNETTGGIPEVIFKLTSLEKLVLSYQGLTCVPDKLNNLQNLSELNLSNCPVLDTIAGSVGLIPNLKSFSILACPSLRTPPQEVVSRGFESVIAYLKRIAGGNSQCRRTKLMFVGLGGAGKTSLLQALMSSNKKTAGTQTAQLTDGIEITPWTIKADNGLDVTYSTWDFAGQTVYYNTHQFFLSQRAVYMLLWNMRTGFEHAGLEFWLSSVACHAPDTPIIVIGTQADQVPKVEIPEAQLKEDYSQIAGFHYVSSIKGTGIAELEKNLIEVTLRQKYMGESIPQVWLHLEKKIISERKSRSILQWEEVKEYAIQQGIYDDKDIVECLKFLGDLGTIQYFDNDFLRDKIVIDPQWIVNVMACVVSVKQSPIQKEMGRFLHKHIKTVWQEYEEKLHTWLLRLTEKFDLTFPIPDSSVNIVPCLLPQMEPEELTWPMKINDSNMKENKMVYSFSYLPSGLFNRAQVRLFQFSDGKLIWKKGSLLTKNRHYALIRQTRDNELVVFVQGPRPENILLLIHEVFESLIHESFHGVKYSFSIPCPDCISKEGTKEPCLFNADLIRRAIDLKAPFLQCSKYFHTVSMGQLLQLMPEDKDSDLDIHLQHSISALQAINKDMSTDVVILFCQEDVPVEGDDSKVNPYWIKRDLENVGLTCVCPDMKNLKSEDLQDVMMSLKNSKVVVGCLSNNFEKDSNCNNLFIYAMDSLNKPTHVAVMHEDLHWRETELGMKIGSPSMAMIRTVERYDKKIPDLLSKVQDSVKNVNEALPILPNIFISYCWVNSKSAVDLGTVPTPTSLGYGDPRKIKEFLNSKGYKCWLDVEQMGQRGLYHDIAVGLQSCKVLIACVSDEYVKSDPCMMEIRFGVCTMKLPLIVVVVGQGSEWKQSEIGLLMRRSPKGVHKVYMQKENKTSWDVLLEYVKNCMPSPEEIKEEEKKRQKKIIQEKLIQKQDMQLSFQEEYELIQRKFMRHIVTMTSKLELPNLPRLMVFDFVKKQKQKRTDYDYDKTRPTTAQSMRGLSTSVSHIKMKPVKFEEEDEWEEEDFCIRVFCEHEQGWHLLDKPLSLKTLTWDDCHKKIIETSPFLARIYAILRQSSMNLECLKGSAGESFQHFVNEQRVAKELDAVAASVFLTAYVELIKFVAEQDVMLNEFLQQIDKCHLPSGKYAWLCNEHSTGGRITKVSKRDESASGSSKVSVFLEDTLFKKVYDSLYSEKKQDTVNPMVVKTAMKQEAKANPEEKKDKERKKSVKTPDDTLLASSQLKKEIEGKKEKTESPDAFPKANDSQPVSRQQSRESSARKLSRPSSRACSLQ